MNNIDLLKFKIIGLHKLKSLPITPETKGLIVEQENSIESIKMDLLSETTKSGQSVAKFIWCNFINLRVSDYLGAVLGSAESTLAYSYYKLVGFDDKLVKKVVDRLSS